MARAYLSAHDAKMSTRTWIAVMREMGTHGIASTQERCARTFCSKAFDSIRNKPLVQTTAEDLLSIVHSNGHSVAHYLRRLHNLACDLGWLAWPILAKRVWPKIRSKHRFPTIKRAKPNARSTEFRRRCRIAGVSGVSLHSYRHSWAQRAKACRYPQRFAQDALGHSSRAVHEAYAKGAFVIVPPLDEYESIAQRKVIAMPLRLTLKEQTDRLLRNQACK